MRQTALDEPASPRTESAVLAEQKTVSDVVVSYLTLKDALVASDAESAKARAVDLLGVVDATRMPNVQQCVKEMAAATDLEVQRTYFDSLSMALYEQVKATSYRSANACTNSTARWPSTTGAPFG